MRRLIFLILGLPYVFSLYNLAKFPASNKTDLRGEGDLIIALMYETHIVGKVRCGGNLNYDRAVTPELMRLRIKHYNDNNNILPNITLGYVYLDTCGGINSYTWRSMELLNDLNGARTTNVVGIVGPYSSDQSISLAGMTSALNLPTLGIYSTSVELSNKGRFEYFSRLVPSDAFATEAMAEVMKTLKWTYIQMLYMEGSFGENAAKNIEKNTKKYGICIGNSQRFSFDYSDDYDEIVKKIVKTKKARILVAFLSPQMRTLLFKAMERNAPNERFIFVAADAYGREPGYEHLQEGSLMFVYNGGKDAVFEEYFNNLKPSDPTIYWTRKVWEHYGNCDFETTCQKYNKMSDVKPNLKSAQIKVADGIDAYAYALHDLITNECPDAFKDKSILSNGCITGERVLKYLRKQKFTSLSGVKYSFNDRGDMLGDYFIQRYTWKNKLWEYDVVGKYSKVTEELNMFENLEIESICSKPCPKKHIYVQQDLKCCWLCRTCRENEILVNNKTECQKCPEFLWPDSDEALTCHDIEDEYVKWQDPLGLLLLILSIIGLIGNVVIIVLYTIYREEKIIKASSRHFSVMIICGSTIGYISVLLLVAKPELATCLLNRIGFHLGATFIYAPLFMKTQRVYRIFRAGSRGKQRPSLTSNRSLMITTLIIIGIQAALVVVSLVLWPPASERIQRIEIEKRVELTCYSPPISLAIPVGFNVLLLLCCVTLGYLTRKLPENFNESWYIFVSVATTIFLWIVLLPTYFTMFYVYYKVIILGICLITNGILTLLCLFLPKIYAIFFVDDENIESSKGSKIAPSSVNETTS
ncbi:DgyrCDS17 [Dimorphilus gyrociliatus]|uniref:DgyrCDS17 n=1 Tax=Dimorphilus gyrociliatus TaxID=2664684 RepID=A0A7I8V628_9ANNE|nr:DgyrCDS17 [Dimorphilus gyrociliatus]